MSRTVDLSVSRRTRQYLVAAFFALFFVVAPVVVILSALGVDASLSVVVATLLVWPLVTVAWVRRAGQTEEGSAWGPIPRWQYEGRFSRSGGIARSEQEESLSGPPEDR